MTDRPLREALEEAWDDGNATGLDGYVGPGRGTEPIAPEAIHNRDRVIDQLLAAHPAEPASVEQWWITTGPLTDPICQKVAGPFANRDEALENRARIEEYTTPITFWVDSPESAERRRNGGAE